MTKRDPVLFLHKVEGTKSVYDTGTVHSPGSIRDQMVRACWIVDRAFEATEIGPDKPFLIVGAGPGGVAAAIRAAALGVTTFLIERNAQPFSRQRGCTSRWIDPSVYEWPLTHHSAIRWGNGTPLPYGPAKASEIVANEWDPAVHLAARHIQWIRGAAVDDIPLLTANGLLVNVVTEASPTPTPFLCAAALWAPGPGDENTVCGTYRGFRFWDVDAYDAQPLLPGGPANVVVSGGGDGALQDVLRFVFDPARVTSPRVLAAVLERNLDHEIARAVQTAADEAHRAMLWNGGDNEKRHDCAVLARLHLKMQRLAANALGSINLRSELAALLRPDPPRVTFVHPCTHFARAYPLNQFLVLLVLGLDNSPLRYVNGRAVTEVTAEGTHHACVAPANCHGQAHRLQISPWSCTTDPSAPAAKSPLGSFEVVVLRHGPVRPARASPRAIPLRRQVLPYELP